VQSVTTSAEHNLDKSTGAYGPTGRVTATAAVIITVRDFEVLDALSSTLARHESLNINQVAWQVDPDNPAWPHVRAAAIHAAITKGRDYAAALGATLDQVEHIADVGLLGDGSTGGMVHRAVSFGLASGGGDSPSLDPVPQELSAAIEARFLATAVSLSSSLPSSGLSSSGLSP
jgi:uncharacterized protein YggE